MKLFVSGSHLPLRPEVHRYLGDKIGSALDHFWQRVESVRVRLVDVNGPKGGPDKRCTVEVELRPSGRIRVQQTEAEVRTAIDRCAHRLRRVASIHFKKQRDFRAQRRDSVQAAKVG